MAGLHVSGRYPSEGLLSILLAGGIEPQTAAWAIDALSLYVAAYALETSMVQQRQKDPDETWGPEPGGTHPPLHRPPRDRLPADRKYAAELTSGTGHQRFDFTLGLLIGNLTQQATPR